MQQEAPTELGTLVNFTGVSGVVGKSLLQCVRYHLDERMRLVQECFRTLDVPKGFFWTTRMGLNYF